MHGVHEHALEMISFLTCTFTHLLPGETYWNYIHVVFHLCLLMSLVTHFKIVNYTTTKFHLNITGLLWPSCKHAQAHSHIRECRKQLRLIVGWNIFCTHNIINRYRETLRRLHEHTLSMTHAFTLHLLAAACVLKGLLQMFAGHSVLSSHWPYTFYKWPVAQPPPAVTYTSFLGSVHCVWQRVVVMICRETLLLFFVGDRSLSVVAM